MPSLGSLTRTLAFILGYTLPLNLPSSGTPPFNPSTATLTDLRRLLKAETVTSAFLVEQYLAQIENHNAHTITITAPKADLIEQARCLDDERMDGYVRGRMHGIPVLVENIQRTEPTSLSELLTKAGMILIARITPSPLMNSENDTHQIPTNTSPTLFLPLTITHSVNSPLIQQAGSLGLCVLHPTTSSYGAIARTAQDLVDVMGVLTNEGNSAPLWGNSGKSDT
jgi:hypothetical protein